MELWDANLSYAVGLIATDGNLSRDGRHIDFTSKDREQILNFKKCLELKNKIGIKYSGSGQKSFRVQFSDVNFYNFLTAIGVNPNKSKTIRGLKIPQKYFFDFLRGHFDGDGTFYSYWDRRWKNSFMFYTVFASASGEHIKWLRAKIRRLLGINGHVTKSKKKITYQLKYAKGDSMKLLKNMYHSQSVICLSRKCLKIRKALRIIGVSL